MSESAKTERINLGTRHMDIYLLPSGEKRISLEIITTTLEKSKDWLETIDDSSLVGLRGREYLKDRKEVEVIDRYGEKSYHDTISIKNFIKITTLDAIDGNVEAASILGVFAEIGVESLEKFLDIRLNY